MSVKILYVSLITFAYCIGNVQSRELFARLPHAECLSYNESVVEAALTNLALRFFYGDQATDYVVVPLNQSKELLSHSSFNKTACTAAYIFGWTVKVDSPNNWEVINAYIQRGGYNPILVDVSPVMSQELYTVAVSLVERAGKEVARALNELVPEGGQFCELAGHSLGAQTVGYVARNMMRRPKHIVGCDPAGPYFHGAPIAKCADHISRTDGDCVEIIHTDMGWLGTAERSGTVDYFPNGGLRNQPGCNDPPLQGGCSHGRALLFWIQSLVNPRTFVGRMCSSWRRFEDGECNNNPTGYLGECDRPSRRGNYFFSTTAEAPFGKGEEGSRTNSGK